MTKAGKAVLVFVVVFTLGFTNVVYAGTPNGNLRNGPGDDTFVARVVGAIKRVVRTIFEQPAVPIPDPPPTH